MDTLEILQSKIDYLETKLSKTKWKKPGNYPVPYNRPILILWSTEKLDRVLYYSAQVELQNDNRFIDCLSTKDTGIVLDDITHWNEIPELPEGI